MARTSVYPVSVEFGDCDPAGIVFFPNFFRWTDAASRHFFASCGVPAWRELERTTGIIGTPLVSISSDFKRPATYGEQVQVHTWIEQWEHKSFVMRHEIRRSDTVLCEVREVRVFAIRHPDDPSRIRAVLPPEDIRRQCE